MPFSPHEPPSQTAGTQQTYSKDRIASEVVNASGNTLAEAGYTTMESVPTVKWVIVFVTTFLRLTNRLRGKAKSTIRKHIAAICFMVRMLVDQPTAVALSGALYEAARSEGLFKGASKKRTSAMKRKSFSEGAVRMIFNALSKEIDAWFAPGSPGAPDWGWSDLQFTWALCVILYYTGARPVEVGSMRLYIVGNVVLFKIRNAKHTNGRAHGVYRTISYTDLSEAQIAELELAWAIIRRARNRAHRHPWRYLMRVASRVLKREVQAMFGTSLRSNYTLYTFRHQLLADLKLAGFSFAEIAAIAGHSVTRTAFVHYAKRRVGRARTNLPIANPAETAKIKQNYKPFRTPKEAPVVTLTFGKL